MGKRIIHRKCPRCKKEREFEVREGKHNRKIICQFCKLKAFVKPGEKIKEDLGYYFPYKFSKIKVLQSSRKNHDRPL